MIELDPETVVRDLGIEYTDKGSYIQFRCINPEHEDKNPSMTMLKANGYCRCWTCGASYSLMSFIYAVTGKSPYDYLGIKDKSSFRFNNALSKALTKKPQREVARRLQVKGMLRDPLKNPEVASFVQNTLYSTPLTVKTFEITYVFQAEIGFLSQDNLTFMRHRICIPLKEKGKVVNMECRDYTGNQKPKVLYPKGGKSDILFNYDNLDRTKPLIVVEGIKSALRLWTHVTKNVTATLGASIGKRQKELLKEFDHLVVFADSDEAGRNMVKQLEEALPKEFDVAFMQREGWDPADGSLQDVADALYAAKPVSKYLTDKYDLFESEKFQKLRW